MEVILQRRPIFVQTVRYDTKSGIGWRNKVGIRNFFIYVPDIVRNLYIEIDLENRPISKWFLVMCSIFVSKLLNNTKIGIGGRNKAGIPKFVI